MALYYTEQDLLTYAEGRTASSAADALSRLEKSALGGFDVFLSHSVRDARLILGLRNLLRKQGLSVYVDWIEDPQLDRTQVSSATAARLRDQMRVSRTMIYATSRAACESRWMPWELGYFDGLRNAERISILPIESSVKYDDFVGQEYLGLYKVIEKVEVLPYGTTEPYAVLPSGLRGEPIKSFARTEGRYEDLERR
ncbi:toll/interleukin-1 receptor domain-containing protein [Rhodococcus sp. p52]|uniref:TIR domain-containing protein n=1 Tax=unclassified Rhodococcus (in: high G+C Gram-positive bacteria) TaxID=192944 RepID=UPI0009FE4A77